jgi:DNA-binding transcriptional ArsR family regulator
MTCDDDVQSRAADVPGLSDIREITDASTLKALAHPVRIALIEALSLERAMTATELGERIGESPTTCSFHLRQLAKYGFVEEAGGGKGRARPWRMTSRGYRFRDTSDDPETQVAAGILSRLIRERQLGRYWTWRTTQASYPTEWRDAASDMEHVFYMTAGELAQFNAELADLLIPRYRERMTDPTQRPPGAVPVELLAFTYPMQLPPSTPVPTAGAEVSP